jgi:TolB-like protein
MERVLLCALLVSLACSRTPHPAIQRIAVLPFENLSGDASLDWIAEAAPSLVVFDLTGAPSTFAMRVLTLRDAYLQHATRFLHGSVTRHGAELRFEIELEDASRHKMVATREIEGPVLTAMNGSPP